ncbi:MAG: hypothetical protein ACE5IY_24005, partial [bacterium]
MDTKETQENNEKKGMPVVPILVTLLLIGVGVVWFMSSNPSKKGIAVAVNNEEKHEEDDGHGHD